ncbi:MAG: hypothetical protein ACK5TQ_13650, partial [Acetobacteraceae bacterium]|nr:hypothetical protein [Roseomonas sp.]
TRVPKPPAIITRTIFLGPHWPEPPANQTIIRESQMTQAIQEVFGQALSAIRSLFDSSESLSTHRFKLERSKIFVAFFVYLHAINFALDLWL